MPRVQINGIEVDFPKEPYSCQLSYMSKNLEALQGARNALLESPTGTGKTLSLLCSTLAWQQHSATAQVSQPPQLVGPGAVASSQQTAKRTSTIIYSSRTHSQLAQVAKELRTTSYRPRVTILGSREQLCIHDKISKLKGNVQVSACNRACSQRSCMYKNNLDGFSSDSNVSQPIMDIEDLVSMGRRQHVCPYFYSRDVSKQADLVLLPYNYLLDYSIRATVEIDWTNAVVIVDEAHNLERVAADAASCTITTSDIASCIQELQNVLRSLQDRGEMTSSSSSSSSLSSSFSLSLAGPEGKTKANISTEGVARILRGLFSFESKLDSIPLKALPNMGENIGCVLPGSFVAETLNGCGMTNVLLTSMLQDLKNCVSLLLDESQDSVGGSSNGYLNGMSEPKLTVFMTLLQRAYRGRYLAESQTLARDYKVYICEQSMKASATRTANGNHSGDYSRIVQTAAQQLGKKRVVNYWSFCPGVAMEDLKALGVRSIILTSGTMSPLQSFKDDMRIPFTVELENPHVIQDNQVWVGAVSKGPNGNALNSTFNNRNSDEYKDELGATILQIGQTMIGKSVHKGPELTGGVLVFFPSYGIMEQVTRRWKESGMWERLSFVLGTILLEPKGSASFNSSSAADDGESKEYRRNIFAPTTAKPGCESNDESGGLGGLVEEFDRALQSSSSGRCLLLAVCRGKVSEGIDFYDNRGRVVIITGIPYAPFMDPWVVLKMQYLDERARPSPELATTYAQSSALGGATLIAPIRPSSEVYGEALKQNTTAAESVFQKTLFSKPIMGATMKERPSKLSTPPISNRLSGQAWYTQSASRAVNQAIGRVIRHKRDWGAIFLLDNRFLQEKHRSEMSCWVKSRLGKFDNCNLALQSFRVFITNALANSELKVARPIPPREPSRPSSAIVTTNNSNRDSEKVLNPTQDLIPQKVAIPVSQLLAGEERSVLEKEGISFINPVLLNSHQEGVESMRAIISRAKGSLLSSGVTSSRSLVPKSESSNGGAGFGLSSGKTLLSTQNAANSLSQGSIESDIQWGRVGSSTVAKLSTRKEQTDQLLDHLRREFSETSLGHKLFGEVNALRENSVQSISTIRNFVDRLTPILAELVAGNSLSEIRADQLIGQLSLLMPTAFEDMFRATARKALKVCLLRAKKHPILSADSRTTSLSSFVTNSTNSSTKLESPPKPNNSADRKRKISSSSNDQEEASGDHKKSIVSLAMPAGNGGSRTKAVVSNEIIELETVCASDRAKRAFEVQSSDLSLSQPMIATSKPKSTVLSMLRAADLHVGRNDGGLAAGVSDPAKGCKFLCNVCNETPNTACAAACGHVACRACWDKWLKIKSSCPICRKPATLASISRILVR